MSRDKQIEEMAKICHFYDDGICHLCEELLVSCDRKCDLVILVENLYNAGYRKATDVASDIIGEITRYVNSHQAFLTPIPMSEVIGFGEFLGELEKKYTEGKG